MEEMSYLVFAVWLAHTKIHLPDLKNEKIHGKKVQIYAGSKKIGRTKERQL